MSLRSHQFTQIQPITIILLFPPIRVVPSARITSDPMKSEADMFSANASYLPTKLSATAEQSQSPVFYSQAELVPVFYGRAEPVPMFYNLQI